MVDSRGSGEQKRGEKQKTSKRVIAEGRILLGPEEYEPVSLGMLDSGCRVRVVAEELQGREFMFFVVDDEGLRGCEHELFFTVLLEGGGRSSYDENGILEKEGRHHLVLSCPSKKDGREIQYSVTLQE